MKRIGFVIALTMAVAAFGCGSDDEGGGSGAAGGSGATGGSGASGGGGSGGSGATGGSEGGSTSSGGGQGGGGQGGGGQGGGGQGGGGQGGGGQGGGASVAPECTDAGQCTLLSDCCSCMGLAPGEQEPPCPIQNCLIPKCQELGFPNLTASCEVGRCVAGFNCDHELVVCLAPQPACGPGETNSVIGSCWGPCVPATECAIVDTCGQCDATTQQCVEEVQQIGLFVHCVDVPGACQGQADCACMGASVCLPPWDTCDDSGGLISCSCPAC